MPFLFCNHLGQSLGNIIGGQFISKLEWWYQRNVDRGAKTALAAIHLVHIIPVALKSQGKVMLKEYSHKMGLLRKKASIHSPTSPFHISSILSLDMKNPRYAVMSGYPSTAGSATDSCITAPWSISFFCIVSNCS